MKVLDVLPQDLAVLDLLTDEKPIQPPPPTVSGLAQELRVLPPGTPFPGPWDNAKTPYLVEIMDNFSEFSPVRLVTLMKSRKVGATTGVADNVAAYWIKNPAPQAYVTASEELAKDWSTIKLPAVIHSFGLDDKIVAQTFDGKTSKRSGSTTFKKEYFGGVLDVFSADSLTARRALDKRILQIDEVDGVKAQTSTGEGNWVEVLLGHGMSWGDRFKAFLFSSPTTEDESNIWAYYQKGDQRKYNVPCPHCGTLQTLDFDPQNPEKTLRPIYDADGNISDAVYLCQAPGCGGEIQSYQKGEILMCEELGGRAKWIPTAIPTDPLHRSYQISSLYAPHEMLSCADFYRAYLKAIADPEDLGDGLRSFQNLYRGLPFKPVGIKPKLSDVLSNIGDYRSGTVPDGVIYLTVGADVQTGKDSRVELEVLGTGLGYRTWSIDFKVFSGPVDDPYSGAWADFADWVESGGMTYTSQDGRKFPVRIVFVDSGDGNVTDVVYRFCARWPGFFASKGQGFIRASHEKKDQSDSPGASDYKKYRASQIGQSGQYLYLVSTNHYKTLIYNNLKIYRVDEAQQRPGFMEFPLDYNEEYFKELLAEEKAPDGSFQKTKSSQRNEALDARVYATCAADVWLDKKVQELREYWRKQGSTPQQVAAITSRHVLEGLANRTKPKQ